MAESRRVRPQPWRPAAALCRSHLLHDGCCVRPQDVLDELHVPALDDERPPPGARRLGAAWLPASRRCAGRA